MAPVTTHQLKIPNNGLMTISSGKSAVTDRWTFPLKGDPPMNITNKTPWRILQKPQKRQVKVVDHYLRQ
jgi:hypothetical protein